MWSAPADGYAAADLAEDVYQLLGTLGDPIVAGETLLRGIEGMLQVRAIEVPR